MSFFNKKPKNIVLRWSAESDSTWEKQKRDTRYKPMKHIRCGGVSIMIEYLGRSTDGMFETRVSVSNYDEEIVSFNRGGFGLTCDNREHRCSKLTVLLGKPDFLHPETLDGEDVGLRETVVSQFQVATFTAFFDTHIPDRAFDFVITARRNSAPNITFVTPYDSSDLKVWGL